MMAGEISKKSQLAMRDAGAGSRAACTRCLHGAGPAAGQGSGERREMAGAIGGSSGTWQPRATGG